MHDERTAALMQDQIDMQEREYADCEHQFMQLRDGWEKRIKNQFEYLERKKKKIKDMKIGLKTFKGVE